MDNDTATGREWAGLAVLALPTLLVSIDIFVLLLALPKLCEDLHASGKRISSLSALDGGAVLAHRTLDPPHERTVTRGQRGL